MAFLDASGQVVFEDASRRGDYASVRSFGAAVDGVTDDSAAIAAAVAYVKAQGGGTVYFPPGRCRGSVVLQDVSNVTLAGDGGSEIFRPSQDANGASVIAIKAKTSDISNVTIRGLKITGPSLSNTFDAMGVECNRDVNECQFLAYNVRVEDCDVSNVRSVGILLRQVIDAKVLHNRVHDTGRDGIQVSGTALIDGNHTDNTGDDGIGALGPFASKGFTPSYRISNNRIGSVRNNARGISVSGARDTIVAGNTVRGYGLVGILASRASTFNEEKYPVSRVLVENNIVLESSIAAPHGAIALIGTTDQSTFPADNFTDYPNRQTLSTTDNQPVTHVRIAGNYIGPSEWQGKTDAAGVTYYNPLRGIRFIGGGSFQRIDITGNSFYGLSTAGIATELLAASDYGTARLRIVGNDFSSCQTAMTLAGGAPTGAVWVNDFVVASNSIDGANGLGYASPTGIVANGVRKLFITGNAFTNLTTSFSKSNTSESAYNNSFHSAPTFGAVKHSYDSAANAWSELA